MAPVPGSGAASDGAGSQGRALAEGAGQTRSSRAQAAGRRARPGREARPHGSPVRRPERWAGRRGIAVRPPRSTAQARPNSRRQDAAAWVAPHPIGLPSKPEVQPPAAPGGHQPGAAKPAGQRPTLRPAIPAVVGKPAEGLPDAGPVWEVPQTEPGAHEASARAPGLPDRGSVADERRPVRRRLIGARRCRPRRIPRRPDPARKGDVDRGYCQGRELVAFAPAATYHLPLSNRSSIQASGSPAGGPTA